MFETTFEKELSLIAERKSDPLYIVGIDEAGRGPLAGPVVASAVCYKDMSFSIPRECEKFFVDIKDSKKLSEKKREKMFDLIHEYFYVGVGIVNAETIDRVNILQATFLAMKSAISDVERKLSKEAFSHIHLLVDGNQIIPNCSFPQEAIIGGDSIVKSIAASSIIAKVTRDRIIEAYDKEYPGYGFAKHKGYGTKDHFDALRRLGPCPIHRMSFRPVLLALPENVNRRFANVLKSKKRK